MMLMIQLYLRSDAQIFPWWNSCWVLLLPRWTEIPMPVIINWVSGRRICKHVISTDLLMPGLKSNMLQEGQEIRHQMITPDPISLRLHYIDLPVSAAIKIKKYGSVEIGLIPGYLVCRQRGRRDNGITWLIHFINLILAL